MAINNLLEFDETEFKALIEQYNIAKQNKAESFLFNGEHELVTNYAKYMIQYLQPKFPQVKLKPLP